jgi:hypothetical protein
MIRRTDDARSIRDDLWRELQRKIVARPCAALPLPVECLLLSSAFLHALARIAIAPFVDSSRSMLTEP